MSRRLGYARVSTEEQDTAAQLDALRAAGCDPIFEEHGSGASRARPELARLMAEIRRGEVLVVVRLDRLARSVSHLLEVIERLEGVGAHFRSLSDPIDTSTPQGMFSLQVLGAVAQLERALISERTKAGVAAARARGKLPGNPGLRAREPAAIAKISKARDRAYMTELLAGIENWLPTVKQMRPEHPWEDVTRALARAGLTWTPERLRRSVKRAVVEGLAPAALPGQSGPDATRHRRSAGGDARADAARRMAVVAVVGGQLAGAGEAGRGGVNGPRRGAVDAISWLLIRGMTLRARQPCRRSGLDDPQQPQRHSCQCRPKHPDLGVVPGTTDTGGARWAADGG